MGTLVGLCVGVVGAFVGAEEGAPVDMMLQWPQVDFAIELSEVHALHTSQVPGPPLGPLQKRVVASPGL